MSGECLFNLRPKCFMEIDHSMIDNYGLLKLKKTLFCLALYKQYIRKQNLTEWH